MFRRKPINIAACITGLFLCFACCCMIFVSQGIFSFFVNATWEKGQAQVVNSEIKYYPSKYTEYKCNVVYQYSYKMKTYTSKKEVGQYGNQQGCRDFLDANYPINKNVGIFIDPTNPSRSLLSDNFNITEYFSN